MIFPELLNWLQGVMLFEGLEAARTPSFAMDQKGARQHKQNLDKQLADIWNIMLPYSRDKDEEYMRKAQEAAEFFKKQREGKA